MIKPTKVSTLGEIRVSERPCTMRSSSQPQARPKALVHVHAEVVATLFPYFVVNGDQLQNLQLTLAIGGHHRRGIAHLFPDQPTPDRRSRRDQPLRHIGLL